MDPLSLAAVSFAVGFSGAVAPGPLFAVVVSSSSKVGFKAGPIATVGHATVEALMVLMLSLGLSVVFTSPTVKFMVGVVGGCMMIIMALLMLRSVVLNKISIEVKKEENRNVLLGGIMATTLNPYWILWWATIGAAYVVISLNYGLLGLLVFYIAHISSDFTWYSLVSLIIGYGRKMIKRKHIRIIIGCCAIFLLYVGIQFILFGLAYIP